MLPHVFNPECPHRRLNLDLGIILVRMLVCKIITGIIRNHIEIAWVDDVPCKQFTLDFVNGLLVIYKLRVILMSCKVSLSLPLHLVLRIVSDGRCCSLMPSDNLLLLDGGD